MPQATWPPQSHTKMGGAIGNPVRLYTKAGWQTTCRQTRVRESLLYAGWRETRGLSPTLHL